MKKHKVKITLYTVLDRAAFRILAATKLYEAASFAIKALINLFSVFNRTKISNLEARVAGMILNATWANSLHSL